MSARTRSSTRPGPPGGAGPLRGRPGASEPGAPPRVQQPRAREPRGYKPRDTRRAEIMDATLAIICEQGLHAWTTAALARRVGVSEASLFRHFRDKDDILVSSVAREADRVAARVRDYRGQGPAWDRACGLILTVVDFVEETAGAGLVILSGHVLPVTPALRARPRAIMRLLRGKLAELFAEAQTGPRARRVPPEVLADLAMAVGQSAGMRWILSGRKGPLKPSVTAMLEVLKRCLAE